MVYLKLLIAGAFLSISNLCLVHALNQSSISSLYVLFIFVIGKINVYLLTIY